MKRLLMTIALSCILSGSALAGDIPSGGIASPPPPSESQTTTSTTSPGEIPTGGVTGDIPTGGFAQQAEDALLGGFLAVVGWLS